MLAMSSLSHFATLRFLGDADFLKTFSTEQRHTLALLAMKLHADGYAISLVFFGFACLSAGYLIYRSGYLPRILGALMAVAGVCYLVNSFAHFLAPALRTVLDPAIYLPMFVAELGLALWLIAKGVDTTKWEARCASST